MKRMLLLTTILLFLPTMAFSEETTKVEETSSEEASSEETSTIKDSRSGFPLSLLITIPSVAWMVHEGGRNPEYARNYYALGALASVGNLDSRGGRAGLALTTLMIATNSYYLNNPEERSVKSRQANLLTFGLTALAVVKINSLFSDKKRDHMNIGLLYDKRSHGIAFNFNLKF